MIGIKDIAKALGVSAATVSLALNGSTMVNENTRQRVVEKAREMGYEPNLAAKRLVTRKSGMMGLIVPDMRNMFYAAMVHHINHTIRAAGYGVFIATCENNPDYEYKIVSDMKANRVEGLIMCPMTSSVRGDYDTSYLAGFPAPLVFVSSRYMEYPYPAVMTDGERSMAELTRLALARGKKKLRFLTGPMEEYSAAERYSGFRSVWPEEDAVIRCPDLSYQTVYQTALSIDPDTCDCVLCVNDNAAAATENALLSRGISVPGQVAVTGYDDVLFAETTAVPLTTYRQDIPLLARTALDHVMTMMNGGEVPAVTRIAGTIVERSSL